MEGLQKAGAEKQFVLSEPPAEPIKTETLECRPCWQRSRDYVSDIAKHVKEITPDMVLIQYTNDIMGDGNKFHELLKSLRSLGVKTIVNPHSIYPPEWKTHYKPGQDSASFDRAMDENADGIMVHSHRMRSDLMARGIDGMHIAVIPHGSVLRKRRPIDESRKVINVPRNAKVVLFFGFIWLGKGVEFLIDVFGEVSKKVPEAWLYIGGYTRKKVFYTKAYVGSLRARATLRGFSKRFSMWGDFVPDEITPYIYSASDLVAMPYKQDYSSVSGVMHQAAGFSTPMLCSRISKFDEVSESISQSLVADYGDFDAWVQLMSRLLTDENHYLEMKKAVDKFAQQTSWENIAKAHLSLYDRVLHGMPAWDNKTMSPKPAAIHSSDDKNE